MISDHMRMRRVLLSVVLVCIVCLAFTSLASAQTDPFYLRLLAKAQKSFLAGNYGDAARDFEIAAFGLNQDIALQAQAYFFIGLSYSYLKDVKKSESFLRQGAELLGERSLAILQIPDSALPDLEKLLTFFDIQLALPAPSIDPPAPQEKEKQEKSSEFTPETGLTAPESDEKVTANNDQHDPGSTPPLTLDKIQEGD